MRSGRLLPLLLAGLAALLLLGFGLGLLELPAWLRGEEEVHEPPALRVEGGEADAAPDDPTLVGRAPGAAVAADGTVLPAPVDLGAVDRERDLHGTVVRADGTPVGGARLQVVTYPWRHQDLLTDGLYEQALDGPHTRSAVDGTFALRLPRAARVALRVSAAGLAPVEIHQLQAGERLRVVLHTGASLRVVVTGPDGQRVEGTQVRLFSLGGTGRTVEGVTGADGVLVLADLEPKRAVVLDVSPSRHGHPGWIHATVPETGEETVGVRLEAGRTLTGRVTDAETEEPIPGARVGMNWVLRPEVRTAADGRYVLSGWTGKGVNDIHVLAQGYARKTAVVGTEDEIDFALHRGHAAVGRVVDASGRPVAGARVAAVGSDFSRQDQRISMAAGRTGDEGRFRLTGLSTHLPHTLVVAASGHGRTLLDFDPQADEQGVIDLGEIALPGALAIAGVVVDADGEPAARVALSLGGANDDRASRRGGTPAQTSYGAALERATDDLGRFCFPDLAPGTYTLLAEPRGGVPVTRSLVLGDADQRGIRLSLRAARTLRVRVTDDVGEPVAGAWVDLEGARGSQSTDADGVAAFQAPSGQAVIQVHAFDREDLLGSGRVEIAEHETDVTVALERAVTIRGRLVTVDGRSIPSAWVSARRGEAYVANATTDEDGAFVFAMRDGPPVDLLFVGQTAQRQAGPFRGWAARLDGVTIGSRGVVLTASEVASDRFLDVLVLDPDGTGVEGIEVFAMIRPGDLARAATDAAGRCRLAGLRAVPTRVDALFRWSEVRPWIAPRPAAADVVPDGQEVVIRLVAARLLQGTLVAPAGTPAGTSIRVRVLRPDGSAVLEVVVRLGTDLWLPVAAAEDGPFTLAAEQWHGEPRLQGRLERVLPGSRDIRLVLQKAP